VRYVLNSAVLTAFGSFTYEQISHAAAADWLRAGEFVSTVGYPETADAMTDLFGVSIPVNRASIQMAPGDEALVFRLVFPPGTPRLTPEAKGQLGLDFIREYCEVGLLRCLAGAS
jgi:hypothetical protein